MFYKLRVHPGSRLEKTARKGPDAFELWVKAPAERGLANAAAVLRIAATFLPSQQPLLLGFSSLAWSLSFGGFVLVYGPMLLGPRADRARATVSSR